MRERTKTGTGAPGTTAPAQKANPDTPDEPVRDAAPKSGARRGGRPPVKADKRKSVIVSSRYSPSEYESIVRRAALAGVRPSALQHAATMGKRVQRQEAPSGSADFALVNELKAIGNNLNQLSRIANTTGQMPAGLTEALDELTAVMLEHMTATGRPAGARSRGKQ